MRALILIAAVLFAVNAEAATPSGCYATFSNPNFCYGGEIDTYYQNDNDNINQYGFTVGALVNDVKFALGELNTCQSNLNGCSAGFNEKSNLLSLCGNTLVSCGNDLDRCSADYNGLYNFGLASVKKLNRQIRTLKRKCGSRCR